MSVGLGVGIALGALTSLLLELAEQDNDGTNDTSRTVHRTSRIQEQENNMQSSDVVSRNCVVCHEAFSDGEFVTVLPCKHGFHGLCAVHHFHDHSECVECGTVLEEWASWITGEQRGTRICQVLPKIEFAHADHNSQNTGNAEPTNTTVDGNSSSNDASNTSKTCAICLNEYEDGDVLTRLTCLHEHHSQCIEEWFRTHRDCPVCREQVDLGSFASHMSREGLSALEQSLLPARIYQRTETIPSQVPGRPSDGNESDEVVVISETTPDEISYDNDEVIIIEDEPQTPQNPRAQSREDTEPHCSICRCDYEIGDELLTLPCFHRFHKECCSQWLMQTSQCPICRLDIGGMSTTNHGALSEDEIEQLPCILFQRPHQAPLPPSSSAEPIQSSSVEPIIIDDSTPSNFPEPTSTPPLRSPLSTGASTENVMPKCSICQSPYVIGETLQRLPCLCEVHADCLNIWMRSRLDCPKCRADIPRGLSSLIGGVSVEEGLKLLPTRDFDARPYCGAEESPDRQRASPLRRLGRALRRRSGFGR